MKWITPLHHLKLRKNKGIVILSSDKESLTVTLNKNDSVCKVDKKIEDGITDGKYVDTTENTLCDLKISQDFLDHFKT